jgi:hypothetical protein
MSDRALLRRACRFLTPASLSLPGDEPRRLTFLTEMRSRRGQVVVTLSPIAGTSVVGLWGVLDFQLDGKDLTLAGPIVQHEDRAATIVVRRKPALRPARPGRVRPAPGSVVAVFVPEGTGLGRCCQPVLDIGLRALRFVSSHPFQPGQILRDVVVLRGSTMMRQAEGTVVHCAPVLEVDGRTSYHCGVRLRAPTELPLGDDPADVCDITDAQRVRGILWVLCDLAHSVTVCAGGEVVRCQLSPVRGSRDALPQIRCIMQRDADVVGPVQVECTLYGSGYRFYARIVGREGRTLLLRPAPIVREWHRREEERVALLPEAGGRVTFRHAVDGRRHVLSLIDVSVQGFGLPRPPDDDTLWPGLPLEDVALEISGKVVRPARATVRTVGEQRCGVHMEQLSDREADRLRAELIKISAYPIELHDGEDLDSILELHRSARLLEPDMARNLEHMREEIRRTWRLAHQHPEGLMRTAMARWKGAVGATATVVRAYERCWALEHLAVRSVAVPANPGLLHSTLMRLTCPRPDCEYVFSFADEEASSLHTMMSTFLSTWSTPEHRGTSPFVLYAGDARPSSNVTMEARRLRRDEEHLVEHAALRLMPVVCARALDLREGHVRLRDTSAAWRRGGLERGREAFAAFDGTTPVAILVREWASPGLSLSSLLNAGIYLPIGPDPDGRAARALVQVLREGRVPGDPEMRFLFVPGRQDQKPLLAAGLHRVAGAVLYAFQGLGMHEYHRYMATRYGLLHGRLRARLAAAA